MSEAHLNLAIEAAAWLTGLAACATVTLMSRREATRWPALSLILALAALVIGCVGLWTPFAFVPRIGYLWSSDQHRLYLDLNQLFIVPLVLGLLAALLAACRCWNRKNAAFAG